MFSQCGENRRDGVDRMVLRRVDELPHGLINNAEQLVGSRGELLAAYVRWVRDRVLDLRDSASYEPVLHFDVYGTVGDVFATVPELARYLLELAELAAPLRLRIEQPITAGSRAEQIELMAQLRAALGGAVELVADEWCNTLDDVDAFIAAGAADMVQVKTPDLGSADAAIRALIACKQAGVLAYCGGSCTDTERAGQVFAGVAMGTDADLLLARPGMGVDEARHGRAQRDGAHGGADRDARIVNPAARAAIARSLERIDELDPDLRACTQVLRHAVGGDGPLTGLTVGVKDNMDVAGTPRTDGLRPPHPPPAVVDAEAVRRLRRAGAAIVAKTNLEELSFGATTQNAYCGRCRNPHDRGRLPGGSSGGSAVAVASGMVDVALGSDTGGSLRNPASLCGVYGLRTSYGLVPASGMTTLAPDFDVVGPMARDLDTLARALEVLAHVRRPAPARAPAAPRHPARVLLRGPAPGRRRGRRGVRRRAARSRRRARRHRSPRRRAHASSSQSVLMNRQAADEHPEWFEDDRVDARVRERLELGARRDRR